MQCPTIAFSTETLIGRTTQLFPILLPIIHDLENYYKLSTAKTLIIGISSDLLFPPEEQLFIAQNIPNTQVHIIQSLYGHDGFLLEYDVIEQLIASFIEK